MAPSASQQDSREQDIALSYQAVQEVLRSNHPALRERPEYIAALLVLAERADKTGRDSFPSAETIAYAIKRSVSTVRRALSFFEEQGLIKRLPPCAALLKLRKDRRPNNYGVSITTLRKFPRPETEDAVADERGVTGDTPLADGVSPVIERGVTRDVYGVSPVTTKPSLNHPEPEKILSLRDGKGQDQDQQLDAPLQEHVRVETEDVVLAEAPAPGVAPSTNDFVPRIDTYGLTQDGTLPEETIDRILVGLDLSPTTPSGVEVDEMVFCGEGISNGVAL